MTDDSKRSNQEATMKLTVMGASSLRLRISFECLSKSEFNPGGVAMVEANLDGGFQVTARNHRTGAAAKIAMKHQVIGWVKLHCSKPLLPHIIKLNPIVEFLSIIDERTSFFGEDCPDHTLTISHVDGSDTPHLSFMYQSEKLNVELMQVNSDIKSFPSSLNCCCEALLPLSMLEKAISSANLEGQPIPIKMEVTKKHWIISSGVKKWKFDHCLKGILTEGVVKYTARFYLPHSGSIRHTLKLYQFPVLYFVADEPDYHIMITFRDHLRFLLKAESLHRIVSGNVMLSMIQGDSAVLKPVREYR